MKNGFDRLATPYRWMEYLTFGHALERCRFLLLPSLITARSALLLGDGDGRFAARLLQAAPRVHVAAVDASDAMLHALQTRCAAPGRVSIHRLDLPSDALTALQDERFDLVATHFFLDCLNAAEIELLVQQLRPLLTQDARWIVSEFQIPRNVLLVPSLILVRALYVAFRLLTGLRMQKLPEYGSILQANGFTCTTRVHLLGGLLVSEQWQCTAAD